MYCQFSDRPGSVTVESLDHQSTEYLPSKTQQASLTVCCRHCKLVNVTHSASKAPASAPGHIPLAPRQTQVERSRETRLKLMNAVVECLVEHGWSGTTTALVSARAGVSRGAQLHHFASRGDLVAAA
ncbi:MAG: TetR/AcrR family transcriptional regulator, partial [Mycobacteriaceae bacterium]